LELITYEGGQPVVGSGGNENNDIPNQKLCAANHNSDVDRVYCNYLNYLSAGKMQIALPRAGLYFLRTRAGVVKLLVL
jgi:hypothetical protein